MKPFSILKVLFVTYLISAILLLILAFCLYNFGLSSDKLKLGVMAIYGISGFLGGFFSGKVSGAKKYLWGMLTGLCYFLVLFVIAIGINNGLDLDYGNVLIQFALCTGCGMLGGMIS